MCERLIKGQTSFVDPRLLPYCSFTQFNRFWLDPENPESFPPGLLEALEQSLSTSPSGVPDPGPSDITISGWGVEPDAGTAARLKTQMQADALQPLNTGSVGSDEGEDGDHPLRMGTGVHADRGDPAESVAVWPEETLLQVGDYLRLGVSRFPLSPRRPPTIRTHPFPRNVVTAFG